MKIQLYFKSTEIFFIAVLIGLLPISRAFSQDQMQFQSQNQTQNPTIPPAIPTETPVQWYEPKVVPTTRPDVSKVSLLGKTGPNTLVRVNSENIVVIQRQDSSSNFQPRVIHKQVRSNSKGQFILSFFMPSGLLQVPIEFIQNPSDTSNSPVASPLLLTMRVDPKDVSLNVKVIRTKKIVKIMKAPPARYAVGTGLAPISLQQSADVQSFGKIKSDEFLPLSLRLEGSMKYYKWWWLAHYEYANSKDFNLQAVALSSRYKLSSDELWFDAELDGRFLPLLAKNNSSVTSLVDTQIFRAGLGLTYLWNSPSMNAQASLYYRVPVSVKVNSGEIVVTSPFAVSANTKIIFPYEKPWSVVLGFNAEYSSFKYEYRNTPASIDNRGEFQSIIMQALVLLQYDLK